MHINQMLLLLPSVDSTNNYAMARVHAGLAQHGWAVLAGVQTAGKGQRHKQWLAEAGSNVLMSIILKPPGCIVQPHFHFSMAVAIGVHGVLKKFVNGVTIKWPNDIMIGDKKAGGILIENNLQGNHWQWAVAGIGINVNQMQFEKDLAQATSLKLESHKAFDVASLAEAIRLSVVEAAWGFEKDAAAIVASYHRHLYKRGEKVKLKQGSRVFEAVVKHVNAQGQMVVQHGIEEAFNIGDVAWVFEKVI